MVRTSGGSSSPVNSPFLVVRTFTLIVGAKSGLTVDAYGSRGDTTSHGGCGNKNRGVVAVCPRCDGGGERYPSSAPT